MKSPSKFLESLEAKLSQLYLPPLGQGGHDLQHVLRMQYMAREIVGLVPNVEEVEYRISVWLHNINRCPTFQAEIKTLGLEKILQNMLAPSKLPFIARERIVDAIFEHSKKDDGPDDSPLLQALRLADKWDRIGLLGAASGFAWKGCVRSAYNPQSPFGYGNTGEDGLKTIYQNFYRILEWYPAFPLIRMLVNRHPWRFEHLLAFMRMFGREVAESHGLENTVEADIEKCLGKFYEKWKLPELAG